MPSLSPACPSPKRARGTPAEPPGDKIHYYYNEDWQVVEERKEVSGTIDPEPLAQYVYHPDYVDAIAIRFYDEDIDGSGIVEHYYLQDANFNVTAVTDNTGTVKERYAYTPYGEATILNGASDGDGSERSVDTNGSDIGNEYLYTGRRLDPETGLQLNRNRFYASNLGRWVSRDPIEYRGGSLNLYEYVDGRPTYYVDPGGLQILAPTPKPPINNPRTYPDGGRPERLGDLPPGFPFCFQPGAQWHFKSAGHGCWKTCLVVMNNTGCPGLQTHMTVPCLGFRTKLCIYECELNFRGVGHAYLPIMSWQLIGCINGPCK